jgi:hypothetical protein
MNGDTQKSGTGVGDILSHFLPRNVLRDTRELALAFHNEEIFRDYMVSRIGFVIPVVLVFVLVSTLCSAAVMLFVLGFTAPPVPLGFRIVTLLAGAAVWLGGILSQLYLFLAWLEQTALQKADPASVRGAARATGLASVARGRVLAPWVLVAIFVAFPLGMLAVHAPVIAFALVSLWILAPVLYARFAP